MAGPVELPGLPDLAQDVIVLNGLPSPGLATIKGAGTPRDWDVRKGWGYSGATAVFTGANLSKFSVDIYIWDRKDFLLWDVFAKACLGKPLGLPTGSKFALKIKHPILNSPPLNITDVVVEDVSQFTEDDFGGWTCTIKFLEYRPPVPAVGKVDKTIPDVPSPVPTARDANEVLIEQLRAQRDALAGG